MTKPKRWIPTAAGLLAAALVLGLLVEPQVARADTLDAPCLNTTYVDGTSNAAKKKNFGAAVDLKIRGTTVKIAYLECVVSGVPAGATGVSGTLVVYSRTANTAHTVRLHNQPTAWTEGTGGDAGATGSVNWNDLHTYDAAVLSSANGDAQPTLGELVNLPASTVTGNGTFRFALETAATTDQLYASDDYLSDVTRRPKLTISYTPPAATTTTTTPPPPPSGSMYGLGDADSDGANLTTAVNRACGIGAKEFRVDGKWWKVEGTQGTYNWSLFDPAMAAAASCTGMRVLWLASYTPAWARPASCTSGDICLPDPTKYQAFANYAAAAVTRYPQIAKVEVWNEPNADFARPQDPAAMAAIQQVVYPTVKAARSSVKVLTGGLQPANTSGGNYSPQDFLRGMYTAGVKPYKDAVGLHPYCYEQWTIGQRCPADYVDWSTWSRMYLTPDNIRRVMHENGDDAQPVEATEFGAPAATTAEEANQRNTVVDGFHLWPTLTDAYGNQFTHYPDGTPSTIYVFRTQAVGTADPAFGILNADGTEKLAGAAYRACTTSHTATGTIGSQPETC